MNSGLNNLLGKIDSADAAPTTQLIAMVHRVETALDQQLSAWQALQAADLAKINSQLKKKGLPPIDPQQKLATPMEEPSAGEIP